jgi:hypothetical protein
MTDIFDSIIFWTCFLSFLPLLSNCAVSLYLCIFAFECSINNRSSAHDYHRQNVHWSTLTRMKTLRTVKNSDLTEYAGYTPNIHRINAKLTVWDRKVFDKCWHCNTDCSLLMCSFTVTIWEDILFVSTETTQWQIREHNFRTNNANQNNCIYPKGKT